MGFRLQFWKGHRMEKSGKEWYLVGRLEAGKSQPWMIDGIAAGPGEDASAIAYSRNYTRPGQQLILLCADDARKVKEALRLRQIRNQQLVEITYLLEREVYHKA